MTRSYRRRTRGRGHRESTVPVTNASLRADRLRFPLCPLCPLCPRCVRIGGAAPAAADLWLHGRSSADRANALERRFLALPSRSGARDAHAYLTAAPHVAGSPRDRVLAEWVRDRWREYGLEQVEIVEHEVLLPYATDVQVEMPSDTHGRATPWRATLKEDAVDGDPFTARDVGVAYHAYSASGDVTAPIVYAGSGNPADYDWLGRPRRRREGQDRARPVLGAVQLSRIQGAHGRAARRGGPPHLLRSGRRWVQEGQDLSRRARGDRKATSSAAASSTTSACPAIR